MGKRKKKGRKQACLPVRESEQKMKEKDKRDGELEGVGGIKKERKR